MTQTAAFGAWVCEQDNYLTQLPNGIPLGRIRFPDYPITRFCSRHTPAQGCEPCAPDEAGSIAIFAAISANGVSAFKPWPATTAVTVAADRDEGTKEDGKERTRAGETCARTWSRSGAVSSPSF